MSSSSVTGTALTGSEATDASMCRVTGYLRNLHGVALKGREISVRNIYIPAAVGSDTLILEELSQIRADSTGKVVFDLYQGSTVRIEMPGRLGEIVKTVKVPEETSIALIGLVYPYAVSVSFDDEDHEAVLGEQFNLDVTGLLSNGEEIGPHLTSALTFSISDEDVLEHVGGVTFRALTAGSVTVTITDLDTDSLPEYQEPDGDVIELLSHPTITFDSIPVTVS